MSKERMKVPKSIDLSPEQIEAFLQRVAERKLEERDWAIIGAMAETITYLYRMIEQKGTSIKSNRRVPL
jgi:hypothetical protein